MNKATACLFLMLACLETSGQVADTFLLKYAASKNDTILYKRVIRVNDRSRLFEVKDYFANGQIAMDARYSAFDRTIKEGWQCNYRTNTKEGDYREWYASGQLAFEGSFRNGLANGRCRAWYSNGLPEADEHRRNGQLHGKVCYYAPEGTVERKLRFRNGNTIKPPEATYPYLPVLPEGYSSDTLKKWPVIIYLHGGSQRGTVLKRLYDNGIPDQVYRGRDFPFIILAPLCPKHIRWSTEEWFGNFWNDISKRYRIDTTRVYLTGLSLGGSGTWYLAARYPGRFAAIAPISGFTRESDFIDRHIGNLYAVAVWAFHGMKDDVVPFGETESLICKLEGKNPDVRFTAEPEVGHWMHWLIYPGNELYDWFLQHRLPPAGNIPGDLK